MQIIQGIRDKGAAIVIVVISLSLIGFILMDAKQGSNQMFGSGNTSLGKVNGQDVEQTEFNKKVKQIEAQEEQRSNTKTTSARAAQIRQQVWDQIVAERVFYAESKKLGINFTSKELSAILSSNDRDNPLMQDQQMLDPATGKLDPLKLKDALANIKKAKREQRDMIDAQIVEPQKLTSISGKYFALLNASVYYPSWMEENDIKYKSEFATISYVALPYSDISDSAIKVSDSEIESYVKKHKDIFKQEAGRKISYIVFSQLPSAEDSAKTREAVAVLKNSFYEETNVKSFLAKQSSAIPYDSNYLPKAKIKSIAIDSVTRLATNAVFGPYLDNNSYVLAKMLGSKPMPDSVKAKHILIATVNSQSGEPLLEDSVAKKRADSIYTAINSGANFSLLALQYSSDGSKDKGGDLGTFGYGAMVPEFNDFCFNKPVGSRGVVKTQFGYHIIEVLNQKAFNPAYKIAFLGREIFSSDATISKANLDATKLSAEKDAKKLEVYVQKNGLSKISESTLIKENDAGAGQLQDARQLIRWVFEAKRGDVSEPFNIGDQFVVAIVDKIEKEGLQDIQTARPLAEKSVREEKKAAEIIKKLGNAPTLESAAAAFNKQILSAGADSSISFTSAIINSIGQEPKLIGACFNKENLNKNSLPITGKTAVYVIKVNSIGSRPAPTAGELETIRTQQRGALRNQASTSWFDDIKKRATIKDNRSKIY